MGTPALRALRESFPESEIHLVVKSKYKELFSENPRVDKIFTYRDNPFHRILLYIHCRRFFYHTVLVFHSHEDLWKMLKCIRYGTCYNRQSFENENARVYRLYPVPRHSIRKRLALVEKAGGKWDGDFRYELWIPRKYMDWAEQTLSKWGISDGPLVGFQLGATDMFKCWPVESFARVARMLHSSMGAKIYVNASPAEKKLVDRFLEIAGDEGIYSMPGAQILETAALIRHCSVFITPDTGPMHLAVALGVPIIGLFCPTEVEDTGPLNYDRATVIRKERTCDPCLNRNCRDNFCMRQISAEEVAASAESVLKKRFLDEGRGPD